MLKWIFLLALVVVFGFGFFFWNVWNNNSSVDVRDDKAASSTAATISNAPLQNPTITLGTPEVVFHFEPGGPGTCPGQHTDTRPTAFRRDDGKIAFFASNSRNYAFVGDTLDTVAPDVGCRKIFVTPPLSSNPGDYHGKMWLKGVIETPQGAILGFIHNEYHGENFDPDPYIDNIGCAAAIIGGSSQACWYASSLIAVSQDGGKTFDTNSTKPLAIVPFKYMKLQGGIAYNSVYPLSHREGDPPSSYMYAFFNITDSPGLPKITKSGVTRGTCIMRGTSADPSTWRMWGGSDFDVTVANPYTTIVTDLVAHMCETVLPFNLGAVKYIPSQGVYIALGTKHRPNEVVYAVSRDIVNWTEPKVLTTFIGFNPDLAPYPDPVPTAYFSLLDPTSPTRSFETLEGRPYMYYVSYTGTHQSTRDLMRVPLTITFE